MSLESARANVRRARDPFFRRIFQGVGIDIGAGPDNVASGNLFPGIVSCEAFDREHGDAAHVLQHRPAASYDFVYSSHCLEDLESPVEAIREWYALVKPDGYLVLLLPDEDLYEQGFFPSHFNSNHFWTFTIAKRQTESWSPRSINLISLIVENLPHSRIMRVSVEDSNYDYSLTNVDQTAASPGAEANIETVIKKLK